MPIYDAVVVCGTCLQDDNTFLPFVYAEIDRAIELLRQRQAEVFVFCGYYWAGETFRGIRECDVAEAYVRQRYPEYLPYFLKEDRSTVVQENWGFLRLTYPSLWRIHQVTIAPLLPRMQYVADWIYGDDGELTFEVLEGIEVPDFPFEEKNLEIAKCIFSTMDRGDMDFLIQDGVSRWQEYWDSHLGCARCFG